jgi:hypothetical protein
MAKKPPNAGNPWTPAEQRQLSKLAAGNTPTRVIALKMGRTPAGVSSQASKVGVSLKPTNQSPYGTRKK